MLLLLRFCGIAWSVWAHTLMLVRAAFGDSAEV